MIRNYSGFKISLIAVLSTLALCVMSSAHAGSYGSRSYSSSSSSSSRSYSSSSSSRSYSSPSYSRSTAPTRPSYSSPSYSYRPPVTTRPVAPSTNPWSGYRGGFSYRPPIVEHHYYDHGGSTLGNMWFWMWMMDRPQAQAPVYINGQAQAPTVIPGQAATIVEQQSNYPFWDVVLRGLILVILIVGLAFLIRALWRLGGRRNRL